MVWRCVGRLEDKDSGCGSPTILEEDLQNGVLEAINQVIADSGGFIEILEKNIRTVLGMEYDKDIAEIENRLNELQEQIVRAANRQEDYDALVDEIYRLREKKQAMQEYNVERQTKRQRISDMMTFLKVQDGKMTEYDDKLVRQLIERVEVHKERLTVIFKSEISEKVDWKAKW